MIQPEDKTLAHLGISPQLSSLFFERAGRNYYHLYSFLYSSFAGGISPFCLPHMKESIDLLINGISSKKIFYIIGDKDADGVSSISILKIFLEKLGCIVEYTLPLLNETYGASERMLLDIKDKKDNIYTVITVDTGIKEILLADCLKEWGIPLIITDHHTPGEKLPDTPFIVNPHLHKDYFLPICGAHLALKLVQALSLALSPYFHSPTIAIYYSKHQELLYTPLMPNSFFPTRESSRLDPLSPEIFLKDIKKATFIIITKKAKEYLINLYPEIKDAPFQVLEDLQKIYKPTLTHKDKPFLFHPKVPTYSLFLFAREFIQSFILKLEESLSLYIQIAGIATICDRMPMNHFENRGLVKTAFHLFVKDKNNPLIDFSRDKMDINDFTNNIVPMLICPFLNAAGRLGKADLIVEFLSCTQEHRKEAKAKIEAINKERQKKQKIALEEVQAFLKIEDTQPPFLFYESFNIHKGVTGIVANKLSKELGKTAFILSFQKETDTLVGSARSPFPIHHLLNQASHLLTAFGGHQKACGFSLKKENLNSFKDFLLNLNWEEKGDSKKKEEANTPLSLTEYNTLFYQSLTQLAPFGEENPTPLFHIRMKIVGAEIFGKTLQHIKWKSKQNPQIQFIFWKGLKNYLLEDIQEKEALLTVFIQKNNFSLNFQDFIVENLILLS